jgi:D-glycero-alpha-D-manno-heptose-7-phosphate kinase
LIIRAKAPLRISFCGGGTDVPPYPAEHGGCVLSCTMSKYAYASLVPRSDGSYGVRSLDYDMDILYGGREDLIFDGELDLVKAVLRRFPSDAGADLFLHSDAPPGSGLGSSSTMVVALVGALTNYLGRSLGPYEMAELAYAIEREDLGIPGGYQDQYSAVFGGFNFMEFTGEGVVVTPLRIPRETLDELRYHLLLCFTGRARVSTDILHEQIGGVTAGKEAVLASLADIKRFTVEMKDALLTGRLTDVAELMNEAWKAKRRLASGIATPAADELLEIALANGAIGGKLLGAGGGGYLVLFCEFMRTHEVAAKLTEAGGRVVDFSLEGDGLRSWRVDG